MIGYLNSGKKEECFGCEACVVACPKDALRMVEDQEGFRYPVLDAHKCVKCGICHKACPRERLPAFSNEAKHVFGGYVMDAAVRQASTSGGAFSAIVESWCDENYLIFGAMSKGLEVFHRSITDKRDLALFRKSKYLQSVIGDTYPEVKRCLTDGKKVLFSGTPCQIAGLRSFLGEASNSDRLLTVEVVCEGVPTPKFIKKLAMWISEKKKAVVTGLDYRFKDGFRWDFEVMQASLQNPTRGTFKWKRDRWINPFWSIWLQHLMSRPSCYECPFARPERGADITLGDLWGVHLYCPELYGHNGGASLVVANTRKGNAVLERAKAAMFGHDLDFSTALKYQGPMRTHINENPQREAFMRDVINLPYEQLCAKWAKLPTLKLLWQKYVWGNRQKVWLWNLLKGE